MQINRRLINRSIDRSVVLVVLLVLVLKTGNTTLLLGVLVGVWRFEMFRCRLVLLLPSGADPAAAAAAAALLYCDVQLLAMTLVLVTQATKLRFWAKPA